MVGGSAVAENSVEISAATTSLGQGETRNVKATLKALGQATSGCSSCFGRAISTTKWIPGQESTISGHGLRHTKSKHCLRKFSCMSSCDVLPTVTSSGAMHLDKHGRAHGIKHRGKSLGGSRTGENALISNAGSLVHKNLRRGLGGLLRERGPTSTASLSPSGFRSESDSLFRTGNWCLRRPAVVKSDSTISSNSLSRVNSPLQISSSGRSRVDRDASRSSTDSCETSLISLSNDEALSRMLVGYPDGGSFCEQELGALDSGERRNTTGLWISSGLAGSTPRSLGPRDRSSSSSVFPGTSSTSRSTRVPFLFGTAHRTRSLEVISSPSSYTSSPDVHLSNPDMLHSYTSTSLQSPYLGMAASSPEYQEGYHLHSSSGTPIFRSFRQWPLQSFDEGQECFTYAGISEQQVFMWEANLILRGLPVQDQYRDLRLDIDSMSYEDLLALEESIGNVSTGLEKDIISSCLISKIYPANKDPVPSKEVGELKCSICQVDFEEGIELGALKCGHSHHFQCIEEWLSRKNQCPICKASAFTKTEH